MPLPIEQNKKFNFLQSTLNDDNLDFEFNDESEDMPNNEQNDVADYLTTSIPKNVEQVDEPNNFENIALDDKSLDANSLQSKLLNLKSSIDTILTDIEDILDTEYASSDDDDDDDDNFEKFDDFNLDNNEDLENLDSLNQSSNLDDMNNLSGNDANEFADLDDTGQASNLDDMNNLSGDDAIEFSDLDDTNRLSDLDDEQFGSDDYGIGDEPTDDNFQGNIRTVAGANLVYKRKQEDGNYEELWVYNVGKNSKHEAQIRRAILSGTDIVPTQRESEDGIQSEETSTVGNVQFLKITGLPN